MSTEPPEGFERTGVMYMFGKRLSHIALATIDREQAYKLAHHCLDKTKHVYIFLHENHTGNGVHCKVCETLAAVAYRTRDSLTITIHVPKGVPSLYAEQEQYVH